MRYFIAFMLINLLAYGTSHAQPPHAKTGKAKAKAQTPSAPTIDYMGQLLPVLHVKQKAPFQGKVVSVRKKVGDLVKKNEAVLELSKVSVGKAFASYKLTSNISGQIASILANEGEEFSSGAELFSVVDTSSAKVKVKLSDKDMQKIDWTKLPKVYLSKKPIEANISYKGAVADLKTSLFPVEIILPEVKNSLGAYVRVSFQSLEKPVSKSTQGSSRKRRARRH